jgi:2-iminobutanoate/2-iminopropanoate deaminase
MMTKEAFGSSAAPLTPAIKVGNTIYVSGQVPVDEHGKIVGDDVAGQTAQVLRNVERVLAEAGATPADVVKTLVILTDIKRDFAAMNTVYREFFPRPLPARSTIGAQLAIEILVEIEAVAVVG